MGGGKKRKQERKLTAAERKRKERFETRKAQMEAEGYAAKDLTIGMVEANWKAVFLALPFCIVLAVVYLLRNGSFRLELSPEGLLPFLMGLVILTVVHELIHGIFWSISVPEGWKSIAFGFIPQYLTPYCTCEAPLTKGEYALGVVMPTVLLGILPGVVAAFMGWKGIFSMGMLMTLAGGGDLLILWKLMRYDGKGKEVRYLDHPYAGGLVAFEKSEKTVDRSRIL